MKRYRLTIFFKEIWQHGFPVTNHVLDVTVAGHNEWQERVESITSRGFHFQRHGGYTWVPGHSITHVEVVFNGMV